MSGHATRFGAIVAIVRKDLALYSRDLLFVFLTALSIVFFAVIYWVLPADVDETIMLGVHGGGIEDALARMGEAEGGGLAVSTYDNADAVRAAVENREIEAGLVFEQEFIPRVAAGDATTVTIYVRPNLPEEITGAMRSMVREIAYSLAGYELPVTEPEEQFVVLGEDRAGDQVPFRDRLKPLYAFVILMLEAISLAALISSEVQERTVTAVLSTPARISDVLLAKGALGTTIAFSETLIILLLIRAMGPAPGIVMVTVFLGAIMVTAVAMIAGSAGKELIGTMLLGLILLIPLAIPAFSVMFPGDPAAWITYLPSYGIVRIIYETSVEGARWAEAGPHLAVLAGWCVALGLAGALILRRRVETI